MTLAHSLPRAGLLGLWLVACSFGVFALSSPSELLRTLVLSPEWSALFHLFILFLIFLGVLLKPLQERLGRAGVAVAVGFALALGVSLSVTGRFHLLDLVPVAALGVFAILGAVVAAVFHRWYEAGWATSSAAGFVCGYGALRLSAPALVGVGGDWAFAQEILYFVAVVWLGWRLVSHAIAEAGASWPTHAVRTLGARPARARERVDETVKVQKAMAAVAGRESEEHESLLAELDETARAVRTYAEHSDLREVVSKRVEALLEAERRVEQEFERYRALTERVEYLDATEYTDLQSSFEGLPLEAKAEAVRELHGLRAKLMVDGSQNRLGEAIRANNAAVRDALLRARSLLAKGFVREAARAIGDAKKSEAEAVRLCEQVRRFAEQFKAAVANVVVRAATSPSAVAS